MKNIIDTRKRIQGNSLFDPRALFAAGFSVMIALGISSLALYTRPASTQELDKSMPTLKGDAAVDFLKKDKTHGSLQNAIAKATEGDDPEAIAKLTAPDARPNDHFGDSVAISGDTLIVGAAQLRQGNGGTLRGAAYIFIRSGGGWAFQQKLTGDGSGGPDGFGVGVAISGDTVVVAAPDEDLGDDYDGVAYVYVRSGTTWSLQKKLTPADTPLVEGEGWYPGSVAVSGDTILVGAQGLLEFSDHERMVNVFVREGTTWTAQAVLTSIDETEDVRFGNSVALSGDIAVVGDPYVGGGGIHPESAYIFVRCGTEWTRQQRLAPNDGPGDRHFGGSVAFSGNTVIIGAESDRPAPNNIQGSAYIFVSDGTTWTQQQKLTANDSGTSSRFGLSVAIMGDTAIVGKPVQFSPTGFDPGRAMVFVRNGTSWTLTETLTASDGSNGDRFGNSVAISENAVLVGADDDDFGSTQTREGSAYAIDRVTLPPPPLPSPCEDDIEVNITSDQADADLEDDECDVDLIMQGKQCSLRAAIQTANAKEGPDEILFNIPGGGVQTISPGSVLPPITEKVTIDATTQPGYSTRPVVEVRGALSTPTGLEFAPGSDASSLLGVSILGFSERGILLVSNNSSIKKSHIGTDSTGLSSGQSQAVGVAVRGSGNRIGDTDNGNLIVFNSDSEVRIEGAGATAI